MKAKIIAVAAILILFNGCSSTSPTQKKTDYVTPAQTVSTDKSDVKIGKKKLGPTGSFSIVPTEIKVNTIKATLEATLTDAQISSVYPLSVKPGTLMSISGTGFGDTPSIITVGKVKVSEFLSWNNQYIWFRLPEGVVENDTIKVGNNEAPFNLRIATDSAIKVVWEVDAKKTQEMINIKYPAYELDEAPQLQYPLFIKGQWGKKNNGFGDYASNWDGGARSVMYNIPGTDIWTSECWFTEDNFNLFKKKMVFFALEDNNAENRRLSSFESDGALIIKKEWGSSDDISDSDTDPGLIVSKKYTKYNENSKTIYVTYAPKDVKPVELVDETPKEPVILKDSNTEDVDVSDNKFIIYQMMTRLFGNKTTLNKIYGTKDENGVGKFSDINEKALSELKKLGITHVWYTGVIEHASMTDYSSFGIEVDDADVVKGRAGSPYAIKDYYTVDPDLSNDVKNRMSEFESLIKRTHTAGMKVMVDFVPNHVARTYKSSSKPAGVKDIGENDDKSKEFDINNNFYYIPNKLFEVPKGYNPLGTEKGTKEDGKFDEMPAKYTGNDIFTAQPDINDWFETIKLNYGVDIKGRGAKHFEPIPSTWTKMRDILLFWSSKGVDGFRCDMAEMVPYEFWKWAISEVKKEYPDVKFVAEIYNTGEYQRFISEAKFDVLYDKVGTYDNVRSLMQGQGNVDVFEYLNKDMATYSSHMLKFLENHDEQRIASRQFAKDMMTGIPGMVISSLMTSGPVLVYFGQEVGEPGSGVEGFGGDDGRTTIFDYWGVPEHQKWVNNGKYDGGGLSEEQKKLRSFYSRLLNFAGSSEAVKKGNFYDVTYFNKKAQTDGWIDKKAVAFVRYTENKKLLVVVNFDKKKGLKSVRIPEKALELMKMKKDGKYKLNEKVVSEALISKEGEVKAGVMTVNLDMAPMSACVFEIE